MKARSGGRSAACDTCGKTFARSDTLLRHEKNHHATEDRGPVHRVTDGTFRACKACAAARARCSGETPCGRCNLRQMECFYPNKRRKAAHANHTTNLDFQNGDDQAFDLALNRPPFLRPRESAMQDEDHHSPVQLEVKAPLPEQEYPSASFSDAFQPDFGYGYSSFEDSMNWIPISIFPSPYENEFENDVSFLFPTTADTIDLGYNAGGPSNTTSQMYEISANGYIAASALADQSPASVSSASNEHPAARATNSPASSEELKRKRRKSYTFDTFKLPRQQTTDFQFPASLPDDMLPGTQTSGNRCSLRDYELILGAFRRLCLDSGPLRPFGTSDFPPRSTLNTNIDLYIERFHATFPLIHVSTLAGGAHWLVLLAMATLGGLHAKSVYSVESREALQEFLRRAVAWTADSTDSDDITNSMSDLPLAQARILSLVGLTMSDNDQLRSLTPRVHADLARWCLEAGVLQTSLNDEKGEHAPETWKAWIRAESWKRVGYFTWLLDTALAYLANCRPLCNMDDARTPLPCQEELWNANSFEEWQLKFKDADVPPSLCAALESMYTKKTVNTRLDDISHIFLINALFQRTWEVGTHIKQPLSEWVPTGKAQGFLTTPSKDSFWLPLYPLYANWRNSACDCLDVIDWHAASTVAKASGVEHGLILHLHLARIILLTPFQEIQDLVFSLVGRVANGSRASFYIHDGSYQPRNLAKLPQIRRITWRWLREDQHKARLAIVHAGSVLWHVRRYSSGSFFEPLAVYLATMVLWTYGSYKSAALERDAANNSSKPDGGPSGPDADMDMVQPSRVETSVRRNIDSEEGPTHRSNPPSGLQATPITSRGLPDGSDSDSSSESGDLPPFIHLDRPCDDEIVQHFVRNGHNMSGHMSNVGDICKTPNKVLLEGAKLLRTKLGCWGISREYFDVLMKLYER